MKDLIFVLVAVGFFAVAALYVSACARILGTEGEEALAEPGPGPDAVDDVPVMRQ
jgi:hypothetical protein